MLRLLKFITGLDVSNENSTFHFLTRNKIFPKYGRRSEG